MSGMGAAQEQVEEQPMMAVPTHGKVFEPVLQSPGDTEVYTEEEPVEPDPYGAFGGSGFMPETMPLYNPMNPLGSSLGGQYGGGFGGPFAPRPSVFGRGQPTLFNLGE